MFIDVAGLTDRGRVRNSNTDQFLIAELNKSVSIRCSTLPIDRQRNLAAATVGYLLLVADGWSHGTDEARAGDLAIFTAVQYVLVLLPWFFDAVPTARDASAKLTRLVESNSTSLPLLMNDHSVLPGCKGTVTMAFLIWPSLSVIHCGSSRLYLLRGDQLHHLTADSVGGDDHRSDTAFAEELARRTAHAEQSRSGVKMVTGAQLHVHQATIACGDTMLLCTDGLTAGVTDDEVAGILREGSACDSTCLQLIHAANDAGGFDNTSVVVVRALEHQ